MQPITINTRTLHVMHNHHMHKSKINHVRLMGAICTGAYLAQGSAPQNLWLVDLREPPARPSPPSNESIDDESYMR
jgi:hypothetical protein